MGRTTTITAVILTAVIAAAMTVLIARSAGRSAADGGPDRGAITASAVRAGAGAPAPPSVPSDDAPIVATRSARLADVQPSEPAAPTRLSLPAIGVTDAPVDPVGVDGDGTMEIPTDVRRVGWYDFGPAPGEAGGSAVLTAHVDSRTQGEGVFYDLDATAPGDVVEVAMADGPTRRFVVDQVRQIPKIDLPTSDLFRRDGRHQLALVTCGGEFDASTRQYRDNLVVIATPAP